MEKNVNCRKQLFGNLFKLFTEEGEAKGSPKSRILRQPPGGVIEHILDSGRNRLKTGDPLQSALKNIL
jgi:hypothetical protein